MRLAVVALRVPCALLGVPEFNRLQIVSGLGVPEPWRSLGHLPLDATLCRQVFLSAEPFVVDDSARHSIAVAVPRLENFPRIAYCGVPVRVLGETVGVLSVSDMEPRRWRPDDVAALRELAAALGRELEAVSAPADRPAAPPDTWPHALREAALVVDASWRVTHVSERALQLLHQTREAMVGRAFWEVFPELIGTPFQQEIQRSTAEHMLLEREVYWEPLRRWLEVRASPIAGGGAAIQLHDVTTRRRAQDELGDREQRYRRIFEESRTPLFVMSQVGRFIEVNRAFEDMFGRDRDMIVSRSLDELGADAQSVERLLTPLAEEGAVTDVEVTLRAGDGRELTCAVTANAQTADGTVYQGSFRDITAQKQSEAQLVRSALQDPLTGLPNRHVFLDRLERLLKQAQRREDYRFAVVFLDLDNFKLINDTHGHVFGDQLLIGVARRLEASLRQGDTVARMGGDEFAVLLDDVGDSPKVTWVVDRIQAELAEPFLLAGRTTHTTASIGIALTTGAYEHSEDLLRDADEAMYRAKASGRNSYIIFDAGMHERAIAQRQLEHDLRVALEQRQLFIEYHPVVELNSGTITGLEALLRWSHPTRGVLMPEDFVPLAEQTGLMVEIGWWVLTEACRQLYAWQLDYPQAAGRLTLSVNLSAKQFVHPQLIDRIDAILEETRLEPQHLQLDLTETIIMRNGDLAARLLTTLRERGIKICIDDFGTGFSSIRQLREFPISTLKIDRSFVRFLSETTGSREIVQSILAIGRSLSLDAVAEGVETPEQLDQLRQLGARFAQGYLFSMPLDARAAGRLLSQSGPRR